MIVPGLRLLVALFVFAGLGGTVRADVATNGPTGVSFLKGSWNDALAEAKRQNKPIFLDVFTNWCPPCKRMAKEAFPDGRLGTKFNTHFINYQVDAETGEGIILARRYAVASYPTALYVAPNGNLVHRSVGYGGVNSMIAQADLVLALPPLKATLAKGDKDFVNGKRNPDFLKRYLQARQVLNRPTDDVLDAYLDALPKPERTTPETISFVCDAIQSSNTRAFVYLIENRFSSFASDLTKPSVAHTVSSAINRVLANELRQACATNDEALLETVIASRERSTASFDPVHKRKEAQILGAAAAYRLIFYKATKNFAKYRTIAGPMAESQLMNQAISALQQKDFIDGVASLPDSLEAILPNSAGDSLTSSLMSWKIADSLHEFASTYSELGTAPADWDLALTWIRQAIVLHDKPAYAITEASLLRKLGRTTATRDGQK